jgi:hypothetical protein
MKQKSPEKSRLHFILKKEVPLPFKQRYTLNMRSMWKLIYQ